MTKINHNTDIYVFEMSVKDNVSFEHRSELEDKTHYAVLTT